MDEENIKEIVEEEKAQIDYYQGYNDALTEVETTKQKWYKSWAVWTSLSGLLVIIFSVFNVWSIIGIDSETFNNLIAAIGSVLTAFGIINNPTAIGSLE